MVGLSLGLLGSGGSILTVPVLIYLAGEQEKVAIAESLGIVGAISLAGFILYALQSQVHWRSVILFGLPGMAGTYGGAMISGFVSGDISVVIICLSDSTGSSNDVPGGNGRVYYPDECVTDYIQCLSERSSSQSLNSAEL